MAYALIAWDAPEGPLGAVAEQELIDSLTLDDGQREPVRFLHRVVLYPSNPGGIGYATVRSRLQQIVDRHPGLRLMLIMPDESSRVGGWFDAARDFTDARPIMNKPGARQTYPVLF